MRALRQVPVQRRPAGSGLARRPGTAETSGVPVLDQRDDHALVTQLSQQIGQRGFPGIAQAGRRLVEQQQNRIGTQGPRNLDHA